MQDIVKNMVNDNYPDISCTCENGDTFIYWNNSLIVELLSNRYLRFRATPLDEKWIGTDKKGADIGWAYRDPKAKGLDVTDSHFDNNPDKGEFIIRIEGKKPAFESKVTLELRGIWMSEVSKFKYTYATRLECLLEDWYLNSNSDKATYKFNSNGTRCVEPLDYTVEYISDYTILTSREHKGPKLYNWFMRSADGENWIKWPMVHVPYPTRSGKYITIHDEDNLYNEGNYFGFLDMEQGGWVSRIMKASSHVLYEICWSQFDVHVLMPDGIPPRSSTETLDAYLTLSFVPVEADESMRIINSAKELAWRSCEEYKLPVLSLDNRFDILITDLPGEKIGNLYMWWASSYECFQDNTTGFDDNYSISIKRTEDHPYPAAWNTFTWAWPFYEKDYRKKRIRFSAMVKTENVSGYARVAIASSLSDDIYYGVFPKVGTLNKDGTHATDYLDWKFSDKLTGTNDWTYVSIELDVKRVKNSIILEQYGTGQSWFDNVKIEEI